MAKFWLVSDQSGQEAKHELMAPGPITVGRATTCNIVIDNKQVSRTHANLTWAGGHWSVSDAGSSGGTFVNDRKLEPGATQRLADGDTLTLPARKTARQVFLAIRESHSLEQLSGPEQDLLTNLMGLGQHRNQNILQHRQMRKQVVGLEDKANVEVTELRQFISGHHGQILAVDDDGSLVRLIQRSQQIEERALARSTGTDNGYALLGSHAEVDLIQDPNLMIPRPERFGNPSNFHQGLAHGHRLPSS